MFLKMLKVDFVFAGFDLLIIFVFSFVVHQTARLKIEAFSGYILKVSTYL